MALHESRGTVTGRVASVNPKGLRLEGEDGWLNYSKWGTIDVVPERGQTVALNLDAAGFIRSLAVLEGVSPTMRTAAPSTKDRTITRLALIKAAAEFAASRPDLKSADVISIARSWERFVNEAPSLDDDDELDEAF